MYNCEDSDSLLYKALPSLQVPSGIVNDLYMLNPCIQNIAEINVAIIKISQLKVYKKTLQ